MEHVFFGEAELFSENIDTCAEVEDFCKKVQPVEEKLHLFVDKKNGALFAECHASAANLVKYCTPDTPLDPEESEEYRANRDIVEDHAAFVQMMTDAKEGRTFSNVVCEFKNDDEKPLKVIGGQHRFEALRSAYKDYEVDQIHGIKVYFSLDVEKRLDVRCDRDG